MRVARISGCGICVLLWSLGAPAFAETLVRVSLGPFAQGMEIRGTELKCQGLPRGGRRHGAAQVLLKTKKLAGRPVECRSSNDIIEVEGRAYRGMIRITGGAEPLLINVVGLDDYLAGVINNEISSAWPEEAVKAQAILARTYTVFRMRQRQNLAYDVEATVRDQVYQGVASEDDAARRAVAETRGLILTYAGEPVEALYHSACGGRTESPEWVWGGTAKPYQQSVECGYCEDAPNYFWRYPAAGAADPAELGRKLGLGEPVVELKVLTKTPSGRAAQLRVAGRHSDKVMSGREFREALGGEAVRSTLFEVQSEPAGFWVMGSGAGHGVGMCQWGARGMAAAGKKSEEILRHYFPGTEVKRLD